MRIFPRGVAELVRLEYADFALFGHGEDGEVAVGVERKTIGDFVNSMCSGRLSGHQLIGLMNAYHYVYLVLEGMFRANPRTGVLEVWSRGGYVEYRAGRRRFMARDVWVFMNTLAVECGVRCYHCLTETDTACYVMALHHWWGKEFGEHKGHLQPHNGRVVELSRQSLVRRVAACLDGVGWDRSKALDARFGTVRELVEATEEELRSVEGIGKVLARSIWEQLAMGKRPTNG